MTDPRPAAPDTDDRTTSRGPAAGAPATRGSSHSSPHRLLALLLLIAALGGVGLATLGATADRGELGTFVGETEREFDPLPGRPEAYEEAEWETHEAPIPPEDRGDNPLGLIITVALVGLVLTVLAIWVFLRMRRLARPPLEVAEDLPDADELTVDQARDALDEAREHLSTAMDAQDAVIAAWLALERSIGAVGIRRRPSQTTLEFVVAVLGDLDLDAQALDRLAHLYRRALFDAEPLVETDRDQASALLDALSRDLDRIAADTGTARGAR